MLKKIKTNKVFIKIFLVTALAVIISVLGCLLFTLTYFRSNFQDLLFERSKESVLKMTDQVSNNLEKLVSFGPIIAFDDVVQKTLASKESMDDNVYSYFSTIQTCKRTLKEYINLRSDILYDIILLNRNGEILEMDNTYDDLLDTEEYSIIFSENRSGFIPSHKFTYNVNIGYWQVIPYVFNVYSTEDYSYIGKTIILAKYDQIIGDLLHFDENSGIDLALFNENGRLFYSSDYSRDFKEEYLNSHGGRDYYFKEKLFMNDWEVICCVSGALINDNINRTYRIVFIVLFFVLIILMIIIYNVVLSLMNPLYMMVDGMRRVSSGEHGVKLDIRTGDEIEEVSHVFNDMVSDIEISTREMLESQKKENEAKIKMLICQINPHFVYNTLNCVICLARKNDNEGIISLTKTFITLLRSVIRVDTDIFTTIYEEKNYIDNYVDVLRYSYHSIPNITWNIDQELLTGRILKQTLYPLVENSIFHGILPTDGQHELIVSIKREGDLIKVMVADNGRGMNNNEIKDLQECLAAPEKTDGNHIGLQNVNNRLRLVFGEMSAISIESYFGEGTKISFSYPLNAE